MKGHLTAQELAEEALAEIQVFMDLFDAEPTACRLVDMLVLQVNMRLRSVEAKKLDAEIAQELSTMAGTMDDALIRHLADYKREREECKLR